MVVWASWAMLASLASPCGHLFATHINGLTKFSLFEFPLFLQFDMLRECLIGHCGMFMHSEGAGMDQETGV